MKTTLALALIFVHLSAAAVIAGEADVIGAKMAVVGDRLYRFEVTVRHTDTGWKHYADKWEVVDEKGAILGTRVLHHPHVDEQPFTRSLSGVKIPETVKAVTIRAHDSVHAYGGEVITLQLP